MTNFFLLGGCKWHKKSNNITIHYDPNRHKETHTERRTTDFWGEPELKNRLEVDEVALALPIQRFEGTVPKSDPKIGPKIGPKKLTPQARLDMIIAIIKDNPLITREEIAKSVGVGHTTIQNDLRTLRKQYGLRYEGSSKTGQWVIDKKDTQ